MGWGGGSPGECERAGMSVLCRPALLLLSRHGRLLPHLGSGLLVSSTTTALAALPCPPFLAVP